MDEAAPLLPPKPPLGFLGWIAAYKLVKAVLMTAAGVMALHLVHRDLTAITLRLLAHLAVDPHGKFADKVLAKLLHVNDQRLRLLGAGFFTYAVLYAVEGVGLWLEERWAEWLTVATTCLLIPLEIWEVFRRTGPARILILGLNLLFLGYLLWRLRKDKPAPPRARFPSPPKKLPVESHRFV